MSHAFSRRTALGLLGAGSLAAGLAGCSTRNSAGQTSTGTKQVQGSAASTHLNVSGPTQLTYDPATGFPGLGTLGYEAVYDGLLRWDETSNTFPGWLATTAKLNDTLSQMDVTLHDNVKFTDGTTMDADGVTKVLTAVANGFPNSMTFVDLKGYYGAEFVKTGDLSFTITTSKAPMDNPFLQVMANCPIPSAAAMDNSKALTTKPVGSGPYVIDPKGSAAGSQLNYKRNAGSWNRSAFPYDTITIRQFDDDVASFNALKSGQIDLTSVNIKDVPEARGSGFNTPLVPDWGYHLFRFGDLLGKINPAIGNVQVRQAICMAFDRKGINQTINLGLGGTSCQVFKKGQPEYIDGGDDRYAFNPTKAKQLLAAAGYPNGFELVIPTYSGYTADVEAIAKQALTNIGITVKYDVKPDAGTWFADLHKYAVFMFSSDIYANTIVNHIQAAGQFVVWPLDPKTQALIKSINSTTGDKQRVFGQQLGKLVLDQAWMTTITTTPAAWAAAKNVDAVLSPLSGTVYLRDIRPAS